MSPSAYSIQVQQYRDSIQSLSKESGLLKAALEDVRKPLMRVDQHADLKFLEKWEKIIAVSTKSQSDGRFLFTGRNFAMAGILGYRQRYEEKGR
jgi:hypothetical protein